jgi:hypothetical protein
MFSFLRTSHLTLAAAIALTLGVVTAPFAQTGAPPSPQRGSMEELLAEVRGLRAEIRQASDTSIRAQLLVARLQVQEQRIASLNRRLVDVERQRSENERSRSAITAQMGIFAKAQEGQSPTEREEFEQVLGPIKAQMALMDKTETDLQTQHTYLTGLIADEQSRWTTFNAMLDELAKPVEARTKRQP